MKDLKTKALVVLIVFNIGLFAMAFSTQVEDFIDGMRSPEAEPMVVPNTFTYQGRITTPEGTPVTDNTYRIEFWFYNTDDLLVTNELCYWTVDDVVLKQGNFRVVMGTSGTGTCNGTSGPTFAEMMAENSEVWMQLKIKAPSSVLETLEPRISVGAVPRAQHSQVSEVAKYAIHGVPVGTVVPFMGDSAPEGWLVADGRTIDYKDNPEYEALIIHLKNLANTEYENCNATTCAIIPDLTGVFLRGANINNNYSKNRNPYPANQSQLVGNYTNDTYAEHNHGGLTESSGSHNHSASTSGAGGHSHTFGINMDDAPRDWWRIEADAGNPSGTATTSAVPDHSHGVTINNGGSHEHGISNQGGIETAPKFVSVLYIIKY